MKKYLLFPIAFLVTAVALFYAWSDWSGARELKAALRQLEEKKESTRLEDFIPPSIPDELNVAEAPIFREFFVSGNESRLGKLAQPWKGSIRQGSGENPLVRIAREIDPVFSGDEASAGHVVLDSLASSGPVLDAVREALRRPQVLWPMDYSKGFEMPFPQIGPIMQAARMLQSRALAALAAGTPAKAFGDANTLLALSEASSSHLLIGELVRISILSLARDIIVEGIGRRAWSDSELTVFSERLEKIHLVAKLADVLRMERATTQQMVWNDPRYLDSAMSSGEVRKRTMAEILWNAAWRLRPAGWSYCDKALYLQFVQQIIDALGDGSRIAPAEFTNLASVFKNASLWNRVVTPMTLVAIPAVDKIPQKIVSAQTLLECTQTACAVERYRLANDRLPEHLAAIAPTFLSEVPKDPLSGASLLYKTSQDGSFVIYGVGWNQADDGGSISSPQIRASDQQADWGISVSYR